jgi:hypothetical protein
MAVAAVNGSMAVVICHKLGRCDLRAPDEVVKVAVTRPSLLLCRSRRVTYCREDIRFTLRILAEGRPMSARLPTEDAFWESIGGAVASPCPVWRFVGERPRVNPICVIRSQQMLRSCATTGLSTNPLCSCASNGPSGTQRGFQHRNQATTPLTSHMSVPALVSGLLVEGRPLPIFYRGGLGT